MLYQALHHCQGKASGNVTAAAKRLVASPQSYSHRRHLFSSVMDNIGKSELHFLKTWLYPYEYKQPSRLAGK